LAPASKCEDEHSDAKLSVSGESLSVRTDEGPINKKERVSGSEGPETRSNSLPPLLLAAICQVLFLD
jgi:hypothetical protein